MRFLKKYTPLHYKMYLDNVDYYLNKNKKYNDDINMWIKELDNSHLIFLSKSMSYLLNNSRLFFEESAIIMTLIIKLFMIELDLETQEIKLTINDLKKLILRFDKILKFELQLRMNKSTEYRNIIYTLVKDINY